MLVELHIKDFAIIDQISLHFREGLTVITGETGAGKSIIVDAVNLVLGGPTDRDFVRAGASRAAVDAIFRIPANLRDSIKPLLDEEAVEYDTLDELTMTREVRDNGRSFARINGTPCKLSTYKEIGGLLVDIHGQSEHLSLLKPKQHVYLLDRFANLQEARLELAGLVRHYHQVQREIEALQQDEAAVARRVDILEYQIEEIETARLRTGEEEELQAESKRLANSEKLFELTAEVRRLLYAGEAGESAAVELLDEAAIVLGKLAKLDGDIQAAAELAQTISVQAEELAEDVRRYADRIDVTPGRLDEVEERLQTIGLLKRKYGGSVEAVLKFLEKARGELASITSSGERLQELHQNREALLREIGEKSAKISTSRHAAGKEISAAIEGELKHLRMAAARFEVQIENQEDPEGCYVGDKRYEFDVTGIDHVEFMLATNFGEPLKPLAKVASGGETARSMLALKSVLSRADETPALIFDEIDQGIGGRLGTVVGEKLWRLSGHHQVFCVTHLAQLASFADSHFRVSKHVVGNRTITQVQRLENDTRLTELMEMLGTDTESGRQSAGDLITLANQVKAGEWVEFG